MKRMLKPPRLQRGDTIGVVSPSTQAHNLLSEKYLKGIGFLKSLGFEILEGENMRKTEAPGPVERATDINQLWANPEVKMLITSIGGFTAGSTLPYLDWELLRRDPKFLCGFSDITALHCGILTQTNCVSLYGPAVVAGFGEPPQPPAYSLESFMIQSGLMEATFPYRHPVPKKWTREFVDAKEPGWDEKRKTWNENAGWKVLKEGQAKGRLYVFNENTLLTLVGTPYFPDLRGCILVLEQAGTNLGYEERHLNQLKMMGVFGGLKGLLVSKVEQMLSGFTQEEYDELVAQFCLLPAGAPVVTQFDCAHTLPMMTLPQGLEFELNADESGVDLLQMEAGYS